MTNWIDHYDKLEEVGERRLLNRYETWEESAEWFSEEYFPVKGGTLSRAYNGMKNGYERDSMKHETVDYVDVYDWKFLNSFWNSDIVLEPYVEYEAPPKVQEFISKYIFYVDGKEYDSIHEVAEEFGLSEAAAYRRFRSKSLKYRQWTKEERDEDSYL